MKLGLTLFPLYFAFAGLLGLFRAGSVILSADNLLVGVFSVLVSLIISCVFIYFAFQLKPLLRERKEVIQIALIIVLIRNLLVLFYGADVPTAFVNTDLLGKFLTFMIFGMTIAIYAALIYGIQVLSKKVIAAEEASKEPSTHSLDKP